MIGIGNPLRGDDGVGIWLAERAERWRPAPRVLTVQQLTPELSDVLARVQRVLFVDAWLANRTQAAGMAAAASSDRSLQPLLQRLPLTPGPPDDGVSESAVLSHGLDPLQLLAITALLQGATPAGWLLLVPAFALGHTQGFSPALWALLPRAEALLEAWCDRGCPLRQHTEAAPDSSTLDIGAITEAEDSDCGGLG